jgi:hypothetical protein
MHKSEDKGYKLTTNCELDADTRETLLQHLAEHGPASLLTSNKFGQYAGCFPEGITSAIAAESALTASAAADDSTGTGRHQRHTKPPSHPLRCASASNQDELPPAIGKGGFDRG